MARLIMACMAAWICAKLRDGCSGIGSASCRREKWPWIPGSLGPIKHRIGPTSQGFFLDKVRALAALVATRTLHPNLACPCTEGIHATWWDTRRASMEPHLFRGISLAGS